MDEKEEPKNNCDEKIRNIQPPDMIKDPKNFNKYKMRLKRWSKLSPLSHQAQFDVVMMTIDDSHPQPLSDKLEEELGESEEAATKGIQVIIEKLEEIYGKEEEIDAFRNFREFKGTIHHKIFFRLSSENTPFVS